MVHWWILGAGFPIDTHYCSRNIWATYGLHMGHIWGPVLQHMELFQHMGKKILQKAQHMGNIWVSFSNIWGSFETYRSFLKHMGPFWNIWGLSWKVFVSFSDLPHCIIPVYEFFFFLKSFANHKSGLFPIFLPKKNVCWKFQGEPETCFLPSKLEPESHSSWSCERDCVSARSYAYYADDAPTVACGLDLVWFFELRRGRLKSARMRKFKMSAARKDWSRRTTSKLELQLFLMSWWVQVSSLHACRIVTTIDRRWLWPRGRHGGVF